MSDIEVADLDTLGPSDPTRSKGKGKAIAKAVDEDVDELDEQSEIGEAESELESFEPVKRISSRSKGKGRALEIESDFETGPPKKRTRVCSGKAKAGPSKVTTRRNFIVSDDEEESEFDLTELSADESEYEEGNEAAPVVESEASDSEPEVAILPPPLPPRQRARVGRLRGRVRPIGIV